MPRPMKMPDRLRDFLAELDVPYELRWGNGDHIKIFVGGALVGVAPAHRREGSQCAHLNLVSRIRKAAKIYRSREFRD